MNHIKRPTDQRQLAMGSLPEYLDALEKMPRTLDVGAQIPHLALRTYVMGGRGVTHDEATQADIKEMVRLVDEGLRAGALGFSTNHTMIHKYQTHKYLPGTFAPSNEIMGIAKTLGKAGLGVFQMTANHYQVETEVPWLTEVAKANNLPIAYAAGIPLYGAVAGRHAWQKIAVLPWLEKLAQLNNAEIRAQLTSMEFLHKAAQFDSRLFYLTQSFHKMYAVGVWREYEPAQEHSIASIAARNGASSLDVAYDIPIADPLGQR
jgi:N-acyl-D-amino-acid deacylase